MPKLSKVISGGQTGADQAGIFAAKDLGFATGGYAPKGYRTTDGPNLALADYGLVEHPSALYPPRTESNVICSDGTIALAFNFLSAGEKLTRKLCIRHDKPILMIDLDACYKSYINIGDECLADPVNKILTFIEDNDISVLNVAGNSNETNENSFKMSYLILMAAFSRCEKI